MNLPAGEKRDRLPADVGGKGRLGHTPHLRLARHDVAARLRHHFIEYAACQKDHAGLQNRDQQGQKRRRHQAEFDGRGAAIACR
jgi:hypothetical protein